MRICLVICLFALLSIALPAQAQDSLLPPCSHAAAWRARRDAAGVRGSDCGGAIHV